MYRLFFGFLIAALPSVSFAQSVACWLDSLSAREELSASIATNKDLRPLWSYSNRWGVYTQYERAEFFASARADIRILHTPHTNLHAGLGLVASTDDSRRVPHEAYLSGNVFMFDYLAGMKAYSPLAADDDVSSGNYLMSSNARPTPRIGLGIFDYFSVPFTRDWLQVKGGVFVGRLFDDDFDDDYTSLFTTSVTLHEKFAYVRIGGWYVKPYIGLVHSVLIGGTTPDGHKIPTDFWASFFGRGSEDFRDYDGGWLRGEATNAAGAHQGIWDFGADFSLGDFKAHLYYQRIFTDAVGVDPLSKYVKDYYLGLTLHTPSPLFRKVNVEYVKTYDQMGDGTPDPIGRDKNGALMAVYPGDFPLEQNALMDWLHEHFTDEDLADWQARSGKPLNYHTVNTFLRDHWGNGEKSGRKVYLNNGLYYQGWTQNGLSLGTPLFHSAKTMRAYMSDSDRAQMLIFLANTRVAAVNIGLVGNVSPRHSYQFRYTFSRNHGNIVEKYDGGAFSMTPYKDYFYESAKIQNYLLLSTSYDVSDGFLNLFRLRFEVAADFGELYSSTAFRVACIHYLNFRHVR